MSDERGLTLKFLDEVADEVLTGKEIKGKGGNPMGVELVDEVTGQVVESGPGCSGKVELLLLKSSENDDVHNWSHRDFNSQIIKESDKTKPHFAKHYYVYLEKGTGIVNNAKLAHDANWMKSCKCRLGARLNLTGIRVKEAWTKSFVVCDSRSKLYGKSYPPSLSDHVWRLEKISKDGAPCKRLKEKRITTVEHFLFMLSVDPQKLQEIIGVRSTNDWKAIVEHARTCIIDDPRIYTYYNASSEHNFHVVFDVVGGLKGIIYDSHYVPADDLSKDQKDRAQKLLLSAFENQKDITSFDDEMTFLHRFPYRASNDATAISTPGNFDPTIIENIIHCDTTLPSSSSQAITPYIAPPHKANNSFDVDLRSLERFDSLNHVLDNFWCTEDTEQNEYLVSTSNHEDSNFSETLGNELRPCRQSNAGKLPSLRDVAIALILVNRAREKLMALGLRHMNRSKRKRI
ncbi:calmodulin-binding protein 60 A-like isoform X2 [Andrographis paniculata]|nr:calmodulin-binding protein 60 A-like isoform X2 [Andrographis paniculata]XP_051123293.1 calmodulin-binding protein 60 A-like isoform X2 [Andrographis paniculata]XP_051123294.1 calmodulin-binding protein 60 A-like isoform X2 [Andrographis paniculata]